MTQIRSRLAIGICGFSILLAGEVCRIVLNPAAHQRHSAATVARWKEWGKAHPNWKPKPRREALAEFDFACDVSTEPQGVDTLLVPEPEPPLDMGVMELTSEGDQPPPQGDVPTPAGPPQGDQPPTGYPLTYFGFTGPPGPSGGPPQPPPTSPAVPEPATFLLLATGALLLERFREKV
jgi:hypothetical protein